MLRPKGRKRGVSRSTDKGEVLLGKNWEDMRSLRPWGEVIKGVKTEGKDVGPSGGLAGAQTRERC